MYGAFEGHASMCYILFSLHLVKLSRLFITTICNKNCTHVRKPIKWNEGMFKESVSCLDHSDFEARMCNNQKYRRDLLLLGLLFAGATLTWAQTPVIPADHLLVSTFVRFVDILYIVLQIRTNKSGSIKRRAIIRTLLYLLRTQ